MSPATKQLQNIARTVKNNPYELWATLSIFVGLPLVAYLYFDYRAAILVFVSASVVVPVLALRGN